MHLLRTKGSSNPRSTQALPLWLKWLRHADVIRDELADWSKQIGPDDPYDPFRYNEWACVSALACAASRAGFPVLTEYGTTKQGGSGDFDSDGRCDLWIADPSSTLNWAIEFKHHFAKPSIAATQARSLMDKAMGCAKQIGESEAEVVVAGLALLIDQDGLTGGTWAVSKIVREFDAHCEQFDLAFRIGDDERAAWFAFEFVKKQGRPTRKTLPK